METVERRKICLCLFVAVFVASLENSTEEPINVKETTSSDATSLFNVAATTLGLNKSTARSSSGNTAHTDVDSTVDLPITPSLKNGTDFNNSSENSTNSALIQNTEMSELTKKKEMATTVTDGAPPARNKTQVEGSKPTASPTSRSSLNTKSPDATVVHNVTEKNGNVTKVEPTVQMTRVPQQMETTEKKHSIAPESGPETTTQPKNAPPATFTRHEESKELTTAMLTAESETQPVLPTKTMPIAVSPSSSAGISTTTITESTSTNQPRATHATIETVVTSSTMINKATTLFSTQQSGDRADNAKKMVNGKPISNPSQNKVDPLVIGMITVFFIIIGIVSLLGFLKYRQRVHQPEFRRLHELPMDDMMEEDTPLSLYSY
ncbi:uncharacterized protein LOC144598368 [Rhinoraja longicauda]